MDYLRANLVQLYDSQVACYSGRGVELYQAQQWQTVPKEKIKKQFQEGIIKILLCTESASEGLNLQTCGVLINYDLPWNPMRVEQSIGRDRSHRSSLFYSSYSQLLL
jgi:ERCC4-related helicase